MSPRGLSVIQRQHLLTFWLEIVNNQERTALVQTGMAVILFHLYSLKTGYSRFCTSDLLITNVDQILHF